MLLTDLTELKHVLDIPTSDTGDDAKLLILIEQAGDVIEEFLGRKGRLIKKERTEYYRGTATQKLLLRCRPVFTTPTIAVRVDEGGYFGAPSDSFDSETALVYGDDFTLQIDQDDGTSRSAILWRLSDVWPRPSVRKRGYLTPHVGEDKGSIRVVYTAGYTVDTLPPAFRLATNILVARLRILFPYGYILTSEGYEERNVSYHVNDLFDLIRPLLWSYRNFVF